MKSYSDELERKGNQIGNLMNQIQVLQNATANMREESADYEHKVAGKFVQQQTYWR